MENLPSLNIFVALIFGFLSFLSPCILPLLPGYLSFIAGSNLNNNENPSRRQALLNSLGFVIGFSLLFVAFGAAASSVGQWLISYQSFIIKVSGVIIILFGLHISELLPLHLLLYQKRLDFLPHVSGWLSSFLLGVSFAVGWTPCVGPILASILVLAGSSQTLYHGIILLTAYAMGLGIPFLLAAWGIGSIHRWLQKIKQVLPYINAISGGLLIAMGIMLLTGIWQKLVVLFY